MSKLLQLILVSVLVLNVTLLPLSPAAAQGFQPLVPASEQATLIELTKCNTSEVKNGKRWGWGGVAFGSEINDGDYLNLIQAVGNSIKDRDADALVAFFQNQTDEMIDKLGPEVEQMGKRAIADLVTRVFFDRGSTQRILEGGLELEAGIARINCWLEITYGEPRTYQCKVYFPCAVPKACGWTWQFPPCSTIEPVTRQFEWFPKYLPYVRYRVNKNLPQFPLSAVTQVVQSIQSNLENLRGLEKKLREELAQSEAEIQQQLKQEASEIIAIELAAAIEKRISVIPRHKFVPLLREIVGRVLDRRGFSKVTLDTILNGLANDMSGLLQETITEFNARIKEVISTQPGALVLDWASSNRSAIRAEIMGTGDWHVVWGANVDEIEYARFAAAIAAAIPTAGGSLAEYFGTYLEKTVSRVQQQAPEIGRKVLFKLIAQAMTDRGKVFRHLNIEVQAGIATYDRWANFSYPKIDFRRCTASVLGKSYEYPCGLTLTTGTKDVNLPNHHQPYIKFRFTDGKSAQPSGNNPVETQTYYHGSNAGDWHGCDTNLSEIYVNRSSTTGSDGSAARPFRTVNAAIECLGNNGVVLISPGVYEETFTINKPMTLRSLGGVATINAPLVNVEPQPSLTFDTSQIAFGVMQGEANPEAVSVAIGRSGSGILTWNASSSQPWLIVSPSSGAAPATVEISVNISALGVGQHIGEISVSSGSQVIKRAVSVLITEKPTDSILQTVAPSLNIEAPKTTGFSESQAITLTSSSNSNLDWTASTSVSWLAISADGGTTPAVINVWANLDGLSIGTHTGDVVVVSDVQTVTLPVTVRVSEIQGQVFLPLIAR